MTKRKPTTKDWEKIRALYLKGEKPRFIVEKFKDLDITAKAISTRFSTDKTKVKRDKIKEKVETALINDITEEKEKANKELIVVTKKAVEVIKDYFQKKNYKDFAGFTKLGFLKEKSETINTKSLEQVMKALVNAQKAQRLALDMDKEEKENLPAPVINIDFGEG